MCNYALFSLFLFPLLSIFSCLSPYSHPLLSFYMFFFNVLFSFVSFFIRHFPIFCSFLLLTWSNLFISSASLSYLSDFPLHHQGSIPLMSSSHRVCSSSTAKKWKPSTNVTCSRYGVVQTVKSIKRHFPQCLGSSNLRTSVNNDTLVSSIDREDLHCDPMVDGLSEP
jgi:hypothetical protein